MLKAVLDTNLLISALLSPSGTVAALLNLWHDERRFELVISAAILDEIEAVLGRPRLAARFAVLPDRRRELIETLRMVATVVSPTAVVPVAVRDPKDIPILATALSHADYLVTGDNDLLVLDGDPALGPLRIVTPRAFLDVIQPH